MGGPPPGSSRTIRLDLQPSRVRPGSAGTQNLSVDLQRAAVVRRTPGAPDLLVPFAAYRGVAVRIEGTQDPGRVRPHLELLHADGALTVPLPAPDDADGAEAAWRQWGRALDLPLLVVAADGTVSAPLAEVAPLAVRPPTMRRRPAHFTRRRPRFLVRRKPGRPVAEALIEGREIIARN